MYLPDTAEEMARDRLITSREGANLTYEEYEYLLNSFKAGFSMSSLSIEKAFEEQNEGGIAVGLTKTRKNSVSLLCPA